MSMEMSQECAIKFLPSTFRSKFTFGILELNRNRGRSEQSGSEFKSESKSKSNDKNDKRK